MAGTDPHKKWTEERGPVTTLFAFTSNASAIAADYSEVSLEITESLLDELTADAEISQDQQVHASWITASLAAGDIPIDSLLVSGTTETLSDLASDPAVSSVTIRSLAVEEEEEVEEEEGAL